MTYAITSGANYGTVKWIVSATPGLGTHTTITAAIAASSSGDTIVVRDGTYTENCTVKPGTTLTTWEGSGFDPNVTVIGKFTMSGAGTATISGIRLQTNSDFAVQVSGSSNSHLNIEDCFVNATNNTAISFTSSGSSSLTFSNCTGDIATTGITLFSASGSGTIAFNYSDFTNTGSSTTASTISAGLFGASYSKFLMPITSSGTGGFSVNQTVINNQTTNTTSLTVGGSGGCVWRSGEFISGSASAVVVNTTMTGTHLDIDSSNTNAITGAGTFSYGFIAFTGSSSGHNVTTENALATLI